MEEPDFAVVLTGWAGDGRREVIGVLRAVTGLSAWRSALLLSAAPAPVVEEVPFETAVRAAASLRAAGAGADVVCGWCARTVPPDGRPLSPGPCASRYWSAADCRASRSRGAARQARAPERPSCEG
ncbi:ribosomal protein L7/L12 [Streptomyces sp. enrichment culture]|uniref:ribosomal protein L7/L12 n=1 Tax=Streptomyces sp. enrichment culture TaxID=1795815 RepID=UPI003F56DBF1